MLFIFADVFLQFISCARDSLDMKSISVPDIDVLLGPKCSKPWCKEGMVHIELFMELFIGPNFVPEKTLAGVLLRDWVWPDLLKALQSFEIGTRETSGVGSAHSNKKFTNGLCRSDVEAALHRLRALELVTSGERHLEHFCFADFCYLVRLICRVLIFVFACVIQESLKYFLVKLDSDQVWQSDFVKSGTDLLQR
jgi:hypothetical protein